MIPDDLQPMVTFDPSRPAELYDELNGQFVDYDPVEHEVNYRRWTKIDADGVADWDGLMIIGWRERAR